MIVNKNSLKIAYTCLSIIALCSWFYYKISKMPNCNELLLKENTNSFNGILVNKFIDKDNHLYKTISLLSNNRTTKILIPQRDISKLYDYLMPGDSLIKKQGSLIVNTYRKGNLKMFKIDFECDKK